MNIKTNTAPAFTTPITGWDLLAWGKPLTVRVLGTASVHCADIVNGTHWTSPLRRFYGQHVNYPIKFPTS